MALYIGVFESKVFPERCSHQCLTNLIIHEQFLDFRFGEQVHGDVFGLFEVL